MAVLVVLKPATQREGDVGNDHRQALPIGAPRLNAYRIFHLVETLHAPPVLRLSEYQNKAGRSKTGSLKTMCA